MMNKYMSTRTFDIVDVEADGSCFYRSIYGALVHEGWLLKFIECFFGEGVEDVPKYEDEDTFVRRFRKEMSRRIEEGDDGGIIHTTYEAIADMNSATADLVLAGFGTRIRRPESETEFRGDLAKITKKMSSWVGETELEIIKHIFDDCMFDVSLQILTELSVRTLVPVPNTLYVVNFDEIHYQYVAVRHPNRMHGIEDEPENRTPEGRNGKKEKESKRARKEKIEDKQKKKILGNTGKVPKRKTLEKIEEEPKKMQVCRMIDEHPIYKVKVWLAKDTYKTCVFVGKTPQHQDILDMIKRKEKLSDEEKETMRKSYGHNYKNKLGVDEDPEFIEETIYYDDNLNTVRKKICMYVLDEIADDNVYMWIDREIKNNVQFRLGFAKNVLKGEKSIRVKDLQKIWGDYLGEVRFPETDEKRLEQEDIMTMLNNAQIESVATPLGFRYISDKYVEFIPVNPFKNMDVSRNTFNIENEGSTTLEIYKIRTNVIHVTTCTYFKEEQKIVELYFPHSDKCHSKKLNPESLKIFRDYDAVQHEVHSSFSNLTRLNSHVECHTNYVHLRINETSFNQNIQVKKLFDMMTTNENVPFIKYNSSTVKNYKLEKSALSPSGKHMISEKDFNTWIESNPDDIKGRSSQEFVMFKVFAKKIEDVNKFTTVLVFPDTHIDVKINVKNNDDVSFQSVFHSIPAVNKLLDTVRTYLPDTIYIPKLEQDFWNKYESFTDVRLVNYASTIEMKHGKINLDHFKELARNMFPYFNVIEYENEKNNVVSLQYKRINNFVKVDNIQNFLNQNRHQQQKDLINAVIKAFGLSNEHAIQQYENWKDKQALEAVGVGNRYFFRAFNSSTVSVKVQIDSLGLKVKVDGITNMKYHKRIIGLLKFLAAYSDPKKRTELNILKKQKITDDNADDLIYAAPEEADEDMLRSGDHPNVEDYLDTHDQIGEYEHNNYDDEPLVFDEEPAGYDEPLVFDEDENRPQTSSKAQNPVVVKKTQDIIKMLQKADYKVFKEASTKCQANNKRQPIVITPAQKALIDNDPEYGPTSYDDNFIAYGSTPEKMKKNIYICPDIWCPISNVSMTYEQFLAKGKKCPGVDEPVIDLVHPYWQTEDDDGKLKRKVRWVGFTGKGNECIPCCFRKKPDVDPKNNQPKANLKKIQKCTQGIGEESAQKTIKNSTFDDQSKYIVGPKFPLDPGRYGVVPPVMSEIFKNSKCGDGKDGTGHIVQGTNCFVRRGIYHSRNNSFLSCMNFLLDLGKEDISKHVRDNVDIKSFVLLNNGALCSMFIDRKRTIFDEKERGAFFDWFLSDDATVKDYIASFKQLHDIRVRIQSFRNEKLETIKSTHRHIFKHIIREYLIYNAYTNFRSYLADAGVSKESELLVDIFNKDSPLFNPHGFNIILFEVEQEQLSVSCPYDAQQTMNLTRPFVFLVRQDNFYEPICRVKLEGTVVSQFKFLYGEDPVITEIVDFYKSNCKRYRRSIDTGYSLFAYLGTDKKTFNILYQVIDYSYQLVGFIVSVREVVKNKNETGKRVKMFLPCRPQTPILNAQGVMIIYVDQITDNINDVEPYTIKAVIDKLHNLTNDNMYVLQEFFHKFNSQGNVDGYLFAKMKDEKTVIPMSRSFKNERHLDNLNIFIEWENEDPRKIYIDDEEYKETLYNMLKNELIKIVQKHKKQYYKDVLFLTSAQNPFSIDFKRKKMTSLIEGLLDKLAVESKVDYTIDKERCSGLRKSLCKGICTWQDDSCKIQIPKRVFDFYKDKLAEAFLKHEQSVVKIDTKKQTGAEIRFDQKDVIDGKVAKIQKALSNPYMFVDAMVENYVRNILEKKVKLVGKLTLKDILGPTYEHLPFELFKTFHNRTRVGNGDPNDDEFCINSQESNPADFIYNLLYVVSKLVNSRAKITKNTFSKIIENRLIDDMKKTGNDETFLGVLRENNPCIDNYFKHNRFNFARLNEFMKTDDYRMSEYELQIVSELLNVKIYILARANQLRNPNGIMCLKPFHKTNYFIVLYRKAFKTHDRYEIVLKNISNPQVVFNEKELQETAEKNNETGTKKLLSTLREKCVTKVIKTDAP